MALLHTQTHRHGLLGILGLPRASSGRQLDLYDSITYLGSHRGSCPRLPQSIVTITRNWTLSCLIWSLLSLFRPLTEVYAVST